MALASFLAVAGASAEESTCRVEQRRGLRVIECDEGPAATDEAMARAQASCLELAVEDQPGCNEAVAETFRLRRESMVRRALRAGWGTDAIVSRYGSSPEEVAEIQAEMAPRTTELDPEAQARAAEELRAIEQELEAWRVEASD
jgi:hypothetical protein